MPVTLWRLERTNPEAINAFYLALRIAQDSSNYFYQQRVQRFEFKSIQNIRYPILHFIIFWKENISSEPEANGNHLLGRLKIRMQDALSILDQTLRFDSREWLTTAISEELQAPSALDIYLSCRLSQQDVPKALDSLNLCFWKWQETWLVLMNGLLQVFTWFTICSDRVAKMLSWSVYGQSVALSGKPLWNDSNSDYQVWRIWKLACNLRFMLRWWHSFSGD